jgi:hypothetical protein
VSARPDVPRLAGEDLDLLISRSLDGDLSPEEERQLERLAALDPAAARRKDELAALVADVKALPEPATPFALATRVNGNVAERAGRPGSLGGRFGFFPAPGFAKLALVLLAIVGVAIAILRPAAKQMAEGPVDVFLYNPQRPASTAPQTVIAEAKPEAKIQARLDEKSRRQEAEDLRKEAPAGQSAGKLLVDKKTAAKLEQAPEGVPAAPDSSNVLAEVGPKQKADREGGAARGVAVALEAPAKVTSGAEPAAIAPAPAQRSAEVSRATKAAAATGRGWTISVVGEARNRWSLRRAPDNQPPATGAAVTYRVGLDASGRVAALRAVGRGVSDPGLDEFVRGMLFERLPGTAGAVRDKLEKDAPAPATMEIEIELAPR